jgi:hypothetical protein
MRLPPTRMLVTLAVLFALVCAVFVLGITSYFA